MNTTYDGEVQFAGYSDSSRSGPRITLRLVDRDDLQSFVGLEGKRFMLAMVEIGDDDQPAAGAGTTAPTAAPAVAAPTAKGGPLARLAGQWCGDANFQQWLQQQNPALWAAVGAPDIADAERAARVIRAACGIESRAELDSNEGAKRQFNVAIRHPYMAYLQGAR